MSCMRGNFGTGVLLGGRFETIAPLNHGSFGMVFMSRDRLLNQVVAVKCLTKKSTPQDVGVVFAIDEQSEELSLHRWLGSHPNIVNLITSFETDAHVYLVLEFCDRGDLYEAIRSGQGPLETERVRQFMVELIDAVEFIHSKGIYHRDIKPENIFLTKSGMMKLGDFGLATTEKWTTETLVGSDRYMSPEQYDSAGAGYSPAQADIWAVGICLLNILFSRNPFTTPTETDPLFLDFSRDKQSLFDVFPSMSQDTYEVIIQCMSLDPRKRSLAGARAALQRVVSFTTLDEALDDFCSTDTRVGASSNREPLRTPSLQNAQPDQDAFPWTRALQTNIRQFRRLDAIPDNESYTEDLFTEADHYADDWCSGTVQTPSLSSVLDSHLGTSAASMAVRPPQAKISPKHHTRVSPTAGSLPIAMSRPRVAAPMTGYGNKKQGFSKSWSDMWEEDIEEEERTRQKTQTVDMSRTWSHESMNISPGQNTTGMVDMDGNRDDSDNDLVADGFFAHDTISDKARGPTTPRLSPSSRRTNLDKWAALGERRRRYTGSSESEKPQGFDKSCRPYAFGFGNNHSGVAAWDIASPLKTGRDRSGDNVWNKGRDLNWRRDRRADLGDVEWVGGWPESHS